MPDPDWRLNVLDSIRKPEKAVARGRTNRFIMQAHVPPTFIHLLDQVTDDLDYSQASWLRRAVALPLSAQTGIPVGEILATTSQVRRRGTPHPRYPDPGFDDMRDLRIFCHHPGCDGTHFR